MKPVYRFSIANDSTDAFKGVAITEDTILDVDSKSKLPKEGYFVSDVIPLAGCTILTPTREILSTRYLIPAGIGGTMRAMYAAINSFSYKFSTRAVSVALSGVGTADNLPPAYIARQAYPIFGDDLVKNYKRESNQVFFRETLEGKLTFMKDDYEYIMASSIDSYNCVLIERSLDNGLTWTHFYTGYFFRTDCTINPVNKSVSVELQPLDGYTNIIAGLDKEFDLIELAPEIEPVSLFKRPAIQVYVAGDTVLTSFVSGTYFEQDALQVTDEEKLESVYHFNNCGYVRELSIIPDPSGTGNNAEILGTYAGYEAERALAEPPGTTQVYTKIGNPDIVVEILDAETNGVISVIVKRISTNEALAANTVFAPLSPGDEWIMLANSGSESYRMSYIQTPLFARVLTDIDYIQGKTLYDLPAEDIVSTNINYKKVFGIDPKAFVISTHFSDEPTEYGLYQPGKYFTKPTGYYSDALYPVGRSQWVSASIWFKSTLVGKLFDTLARAQYSLRHAYTLQSCISKLLGQIEPAVKHDASSSAFLNNFDNDFNNKNPISALQFKVFITQKTNMLKGEYDQPAQKALITLGQILNMLRDCFQCYWYVSGQNFKIEHISYFQNGLSYTAATDIDYDLSQLLHPRSRKPWDYDLDEYSFNKEEMPERYQFDWSDDVTFPFKGYPIEVLSRYVKKGNIETISVSNFVSDVDMMLLSPSSFNNDGFALLVAVPENLLTSTYNFDVPADTIMEGVTLKKEIPVDSHCIIKGFSNTGDVTYWGYFLDAAGNALGSTNGVDIGSLGGSFTIEGIAPAGTVKIELWQADFTQIPAVRGRIESVTADSVLTLPIVSRTINLTEYNMQNGYAAFCDLQERYYLRSLPAKKVRINKVPRTVKPTRGKKQDVSFPLLLDTFDPHKLVRTSLGDGQVQEAKLNLDTNLIRATLLYDTE